MKRIHLSETDSTNTYLKELIQAGIDLPEMLLVDADYQTGGRGQRGNSWESRRGENLTFSIALRPKNVDASEQYIISQAVALAVWKTLSDMMEGVTIKWANDIYWVDRKVCGILIECDLVGNKVGNCIIGVGLNVNQTVFESDAPNPASLAQIIGFSLEREKVLKALMENFETYMQLVEEDRKDYIRTEYKSHLYRKTGLHPFEDRNGERFEAEIADVENNGMLVLRKKDGETKKYEFKEVKWILNT